MRKKALVVVNFPSFIKQFLMPNLLQLQNMDYDICIACNFDDGGPCSKDVVEQVISELQEMNISVENIPFNRSPLSLKTFNNYRKLKEYLTMNRFDIIHCHAPVVSVLTRLASRRVRKCGTKVIYTAHGFHFYKGAPLKNWLLYYPAEKICSYFTDALITINTEDFELAEKKMHAKRTYYTPGVGIDTSKFGKLTVDKHKKRKKLGLSDENVMLLSVGELNVNKNHQVIIKALGEIKDLNIHYCIAGVGDQKEQLLQLAKELGLGNNIHLLGYRTDINELLQVADIFCFPSIREGLSVALMEAMGAGKPCIVSNIRGNVDLIDDKQGGYLLNPSDVDGFASAIQTVLTAQGEIEKFGNYNQALVKKFDNQAVIQTLQRIMMKLSKY